MNGSEEKFMRKFFERGKPALHGLMEKIIKLRLCIFLVINNYIR
jgi:hypothetical protein